MPSTIRPFSDTGPVASKPTADSSRLDEEETATGSLSFLAWGFTAVSALVLGVASWQYGPLTPSQSTVVTRTESGLVEPEVTGSVGRSDRAAVTVAQRAVDTDRLLPTPLPNGVQPATSRDIDELRAEIRDLQRRIFQIGVAGDALSHRVDRLDGRTTAPAPIAAAPRPEPARPSTAAAVTGPDRPTADGPAETGEAERPSNRPATEKIAEKPVERPPVVALIDRLPVPRPIDDLALRSRKPHGGTEVAATGRPDEPTVTGTVPADAPVQPSVPVAPSAAATTAAPVIVPGPVPSPGGTVRKIAGVPFGPVPATPPTRIDGPDPAAAKNDQVAGETKAAPAVEAAPAKPEAAPAKPDAATVKLPLPSAKPEPAQAKAASAPAKPDAAPAKPDAIAPKPVEPVIAKAEPKPTEPETAPTKTDAAEKIDAAAKGEVTVARTDAAPAARPGAGDEARAAIDLGGYRSLASLKRAWSDLSGKHSELGNGVEPLARLRETDSGIEARLLVGPFPSQTEAAKSCMRLRAAGVGCSVGGYAGQPLGGIK
jgi:hypothetical protein